MTRDQIEKIETIMVDEVAKRRKLGGYSQEAEAILMLCETMLMLTQHILGEMPLPKKRPN